MQVISIDILREQYGQTGRQLGNHVLFNNSNDIVGYTITSKSLEPTTVDLDSRVYTHIKAEWCTLDDAYDMLYGNPKAPDFTKVLNK